ncbi:hypothetical protein DRE_02252 [Drechslerella stenobrocha 248]|uniref:Very-long-chain (3R)-3-hydroxyacyl-CoA dehydratase n=1 Tax=Drechslerella stenobrocha 248 TaxID=1043628 RepID=W7I749_9PEZI|nr:hypothetical protein DRE_02252 [Drechslerella stenobrocha 248]
MVSQSPPEGRTQTPTRSATIKANYLVIYNTLSAVLWAVVLTRVAASAARDGFDKVYENVGETVKWTQTLAAMEIVHALLGIVRTPLTTTLTQVASRLNIVWPVLGFFPTDIRQSPAYTTMVLAWSVTEVIRYSYYARNLQGEPPAWLAGLRYNTFFILYPIGIASEMWEIYGALPDIAATSAGALGWWTALIEKAALLIVYPPGSYVMYTHMMSQRRKMMRGKKVRRN